MNQSGDSRILKEIRLLRGENFLRHLQRILPLGRKYHPLISLLNRPEGFVEIAFGGCKLIYPAGWRKSLASYLLLGTNVIPECSLLVPLLRQLQNGYLVDVGANIGLYTLLMRVNSSLPIIAYEPQPRLCDLIRRNIAHNHFESVEVRNVGCGAVSVEVPFYTGTNGSVAVKLNVSSDASANVIKVPLTTLDEDLATVPEIALLKIDCEGFEYDILQGSRKLIERHRPQLFIEIHPAELEKFGHSAQKVVEFLKPFYVLEFWCFHPPRKNKLAQSIAKFRTPKGFRYANESEMLNAVKNEPRPLQVYCIGRPR